ncbi:hypothetical protein GmHk_20G058072 [Glycine max]|nr:hypothetical protein GmHk_20G058072 [Glycine max]
MKMLRNARERREDIKETDRNGIVIHRRKNASKARQRIRGMEAGEESVGIDVSEEDQARERNGGEEEGGGDGAPEGDGFGLPKHVGGGITGGKAVRRRPLAAARERSCYRYGCGLNEQEWKCVSELKRLEIRGKIRYERGTHSRVTYCLRCAHCTD